MQAASRSKLQTIVKLQNIIKKMPLEVCCMMVLPEFGVHWREVSWAVRNSRLPMVPGSIARVLCQHAMKSLPGDEVDEIVSRLRLKLAATRERHWHVINMSEPVEEVISVAHLISAVPGRVAKALRNSRAARTMRPEVQTVLLGDLLYLSVQLVSETKEGSVLYVATPPGSAVALVSSLSSLLRFCVEGLGYKQYEDAKLTGHDIRSLLRINDRAWNENVEHLANVPQYAPAPIITPTGIDYTNKNYDEEYVENLIGPDPPLLTELTITSSKAFFDPTRMNKIVNLKVELKTEDLSRSLKAWVGNGALTPTSELFLIFHKIKSNSIEYVNDDD